MIQIKLDLDMPRECHECPFQLKYKDDTVDDYYMRRCVIEGRTIEYPKPNWCPLTLIDPKEIQHACVMCDCDVPTIPIKWAKNCLNTLHKFGVITTSVFNEAIDQLNHR